VRALIAVSGMEPGGVLTSVDVSYRIGPRINASGRLADASLPLRLLLSDDPADCLRDAAQLDAINRERQEIDKKVTEEAMAQAKAMGDLAGYVVHGDWHPGVVGIAAGKITPATRDMWTVVFKTHPVDAAKHLATAPQFVRASGSFLTDGFKVGMVIRWTGWATTGATNNSRNFLITALTATNMTGVFLDGTTPGAKASGDSVTGLEVGKHTYAPSSSHTDDSFSIEHWYSDIAQSELFTGCKLQSLGFQLPPTGIATVEGQFLGKDVTTGTAEYYASATAETTTGVLAAVNGALYVQGTAVALLTGLNFTINGNMSGLPVVGANTYADITEGRITVEGEMSVLFQDATFRDYFINETEVALTAVLTSANSATADFVGFTMPRIKVGGSSKDDGEKGLVQTLPFSALYLGTGGTGTANEATTLMIQDSQAS
jgi:hypothetical protein